MFDRPPVTEPDHAPTQTDPVADSVERLCRLYDTRLADTGGDLSPEDTRELKAMAAIYDLDTDRPSAEVWRDLRAVVTRQAPAASSDAPRSDAEALTLLVVEDDADAAASLTELLTEAGHSVVGPFHSAAAAEAAAALHAIDAALLDINLSSEMTGVELAEVLTSRWDVRVIFISGDVSAAARHADLAEALVLKPYNGAQILEAVARLGQTG
ncbi:MULTISPECIES: response regulator [unclassified Brevundimonas]|mgnify:CR=1 FL=1|uniref:response regulator n=1 Tax=unclassified Brevundimonas TaxID=2622653 RepID=UPI000E8D089A|nr:MULTISPECIES: response regulator [unclassified Brevundimonas]MCK6105387.1 response regulator [Brevundimonas sp. EYE_349]HBI20472.1 response regulator [Brevundimonas sp.]